MEKMLYVFLPCIVGGIIQATTGFGSGIFIMLFFPLFLPILQSSALSTLVGLSATLMLAWKFRAHARPKVVVLPAVIYFVFSFAAIRFAKGADLSGLKAYFGLFLMAMSVYFIFFSERIKIKANFLSAFICAGISGIASGLFGIGGPPMVVYILAVTGDDKNAYIGTSQLFFSITSLYTTLVRVFSGIITIDLLPLAVPGIIGMYIGKTLGTKIIEKINVQTMKKLIYAFLGLSGALTFFTNI